VFFRPEGSLLLSMGGASGVAGGTCPCALCPRLPPPSSWENNYVCPLDPSCPLSQRKVYVKINELCQNTAQSMLNFFLFPVVNGKSTCSSVESPITTIFFCPTPMPSALPRSLPLTQKSWCRPCYSVVSKHYRRRNNSFFKITSYRPFNRAFTE